MVGSLTIGIVLDKMSKFLFPNIILFLETNILSNKKPIVLLGILIQAINIFAYFLFIIACIIDEINSDTWFYILKPFTSFSTFGSTVLV